MARVSPIQESFVAGEISKNVRGQVSSDLYKKGLKFCENWIPQVQGPIRMRNGWEYTGDMDSRNTVARLFTFQRGLDSDYVVEVGDAWVVVRGAVGDIIVGGETQNLLRDPTYQEEENKWWHIPDKYVLNPAALEYEADNTVIWHHAEDSVTLQLAIANILGSHVSFGEELRQRVVVPDGTDNVNHNFTVDYLLTMTQEDADTLGVPNMTDADIVVRIGSTQHGNEIHEEVIPIADVGPGNISFSFIPGVGVTFYWIGIGVRWNDVTTITTAELRFKFGPSSLTTAVIGGSGLPVEFASPYAPEDLGCLQMAMDPAEGELWLTTDSSNVEPYRLKLASTAWAFEALTAIAGFVAPSPNVWAAGNWPRAVAIKDSRLYLAGVPTQPATVWGSRVGDYVDFDGSASATPDDPLMFPLAAAGKIVGLANKRQLIVNTDVSEVVGASTLPGNALAFDNFAFPLQTEWGASCVQPVGVGRKLLFISPDRRKIRTFDDQNDSEKWDSEELNIFAQDLFVTRIQEIDWSDDPAYQLLAVLGNGSMAVGTYYPASNQIGFYRLTTDGLIKSITVTNTTQGAAVWALIDRNGAWRLERLLFNSGDRHALDSWVFRNVQVDGTVSDLDHLEGKEVAAIVKAVHPQSNETYWFTTVNKTVENGQIELEEAPAFGKQVFVGLPYENSWQLLPVEGVSNRGTSQISKRRWAKVVLRINDSSVPLVDGQRAKDRTPQSPMGMGEPFTSGDIEFVDLGSGQGDLTITQDIPLISEVTAVFGKVASGEV